MRTPRLAAAVAVALVLSACASGNSDPKRNVALPTTTALAGSAQVPQKKWQVASNQDGTARVSSCVADSYQPGGCLGPPVGTMTLAEYDKVVEREMPARRMTREVVRPSDTEWSRMKRVSDAVGVVSVIARLAVEYDTASMARAIRSGQKFDDAAWAGSNIKHVSPDAGVAAATIALRNRLGTMPGYSSRTYDAASLLSAMTSYADATLDVRTGGKATPASFGFAQIALGPFVRLNASTEELDTLMDEGMIAGVEANTMSRTSLDDSIPLIDADRYARSEMSRWEPALAATPDGAGSVVSILDDGVMESHPSLRGRMIYEACYMSVDYTASCPDGFSDDEGSGQPCRWSSCSHGTHVAGISVGAASTLPDGRKVNAGVAPGASYMAMRICTSGLCERAATVTALNVTAFHSQRFGVSVANASLGIDPGIPFFSPMWDALEHMARVGVPLVHSQGNDGNTDSCSMDFLSVWEVASSRKDDTPSDFTNFKAGCTDLWAPGDGILAPVPSWTADKWLARKSGTSMAAPHVAGAIALVHQGIRLVNSRLPEPARMFTGGVIDYYLGVSEPDGLTVTIADDRTTCWIDEAMRPCRGSGASAPRMSLHRIRELFSPPGGRYSTYWTDEMRAQRQLLENSARPAATTAAARKSTGTDLNRPFFALAMRNMYVGQFALMKVVHSRDRTFDVPDVGDRNNLNIVPTAGVIKRGYVFVRDGELDSLNTVDPVTGATKGVPYVDVSSGPVACASSGYYSVYELTALMTDPRFRTLPQGTDLRIKLKGPAPRTLFMVIHETAGTPGVSGQRGTMMISSIPATVGAGHAPQAIAAAGALHVGADANYNLRMVVTNELPEENNALLADLVGPVHPNALAVPDRLINNLGDSGFALVQSNYGPRAPSEFGFGRVDGRQSCHNILLSVYEGW